MGRIRDRENVFRDHDFVETFDGWIFGVVSDIHPPGRVLSYLKYIPGEGLWRRAGISYHRVLTTYSSSEVAKVLEMVRALRPDYIFHDPTTDEEFTYVPVEKIKHHYRCEERLQRLLRGGGGGVERGCVMLVEKLSEESGVSKDFYGVSGSLLLELHNPVADIDLVIYGFENFWKTVEAANQLQTAADIKHTKNILVRNYQSKYPISAEEAERLAERCHTRGIYHGYFYSLHASRLLDEIRESYGDRVYRWAGVAKAVLEIVDASEGVFTPATYSVVGETVEGVEVETLICYDTTFAALFHEGDKIEAFGKLEKVTDRRTGRTYHSLLVGSVRTAGREYIKLVP